MRTTDCIHIDACEEGGWCGASDIAQCSCYRTEAEIRADERKRFADWLNRKHGINTCAGLINGNLGYKELDVDEVLQDYEDSLKGGAQCNE